MVLDCAIATGVFDGIAFIDDGLTRENVCGYPVLGCGSSVPDAVAAGFSKVIVAIGDNSQRARCFATAVRCGLEPVVVVHPTAVVSPFAFVGGGTVVMPQAVINSGAVIGRNCIINTACVVEHDCFISDHAHISPGAVLGGGVQVGEGAHVGLGASILPGAVIGAESVVGAGSVVLRAVDQGAVVAGVPARALASARHNRPMRSADLR